MKDKSLTFLIFFLILNGCSSADNIQANLEAEQAQSSSTSGKLNIKSEYPIAMSADIALNISLFIEFSHSLNADTLTSANFNLKSDLGLVEGSIAYDKETKRGVFTPESELELNTKYTVTLTTDVLSTGNLSLGETHQIPFTTLTQSKANPSSLWVSITTDIFTNIVKMTTYLIDNETGEFQQSSDSPFTLGSFSPSDGGFSSQGCLGVHPYRNFVYYPIANSRIAGVELDPSTGNPSFLPESPFLSHIDAIFNIHSNGLTLFGTSGGGPVPPEEDVNFYSETLNPLTGALGDTVSTQIFSSLELILGLPRINLTDYIFTVGLSPLSASNSEISFYKLSPFGLIEPSPNKQNVSISILETRFSSSHLYSPYLKTINVFSINPITAELTQAQTISVPGANGILLLTLSPTGNSLVALSSIDNEIRIESNERAMDLHVFSIDEDTGMLTYATSIQNVTNSGNDMAIDLQYDAQGIFLYLTRMSGIDLYTVDPNTGIPSFSKTIQTFQDPPTCSQIIKQY